MLFLSCWFYSFYLRSALGNFSDLGERNRDLETSFGDVRVAVITEYFAIDFIKRHLITPF